MLKMGCLNFCLQITSWAVLGGLSWMCAHRMRGSGYSIYQGKLTEILEYSYTEQGQSLELV